MAKKGFSYKLVRDKIPELIKAQGSAAVTRTLTDNAAKEKALFKKLREEAKELETAKPEDRQEEMADILEVLGTLVVHFDLDNDAIFKVLEEKRNEKGSFGTYTELKGKW